MGDPVVFLIALMLAVCASCVLLIGVQVIIPHGLFTQGRLPQPAPEHLGVVLSEPGLSFQNCSIMLQVLGHGRCFLSASG